MAVLQNITLVRRAEEQARERLSELESIYRNAPVGLSFVDRELRYLRVNQAIADLNGISCEEMVGKRYRDLSPENADTAEPFLLGLMRSGTSVRNLETVARPPADPDVDHHFLLSMDPVRLADGEVVGHTAAVQDVTELRRIEAAAAQRLAELEILYANTPAGLCYVDTDLRIIHVNALFAQLSPVPPDALIGAPVAEVLPQQLEQQLLPQLGYALRSGASSANLTIRGRVPGSGEREYTWIAHTHPTRGSDETVTGLVTVLQDITPLADRQRELEADARRLVEGQQIAQVGSFEWDLIEDGVWWSPEMYAISGRTQALSYVGFFEVVHPDDRDKVRAQVDRTLSDGDPARLTFRILHPDGSQREIFGISRVDRNAEGIPARMVGTWQDVTQFGKP
jgi:PAS domain S-box-containing protein